MREARAGEVRARDGGWERGWEGGVSLGWGCWCMRDAMDVWGFRLMAVAEAPSCVSEDDQAILSRRIRGID